MDQAFHVTNTSSDGKLDRIRLRCFKSRYGFSGDVIYRYAEGRLVRDDRVDAPARTAADELTELLRQNPGVKTGRFEELAEKRGVSRSKIRGFLANGVQGDLIELERGSKNAKRYSLKASSRD